MGITQFAPRVMSESKSQFAGTLLLILTIAAIIAGVLSFEHLRVISPT